MFSGKFNIQFQADNHRILATENFKSLEDYSLFLIHQNDYKEAAAMAGNKTVLDFGCNNGYGTHLISSQCKKIIGVDVSPRAIAEAIRRYGSNGIEFRLIDGIRSPFEDGTFDLVVSFQVIEHITDVGSYLSEIKRVLAPKGKAVFTTPNALIRLDPGMTPWNSFHVREFSPAELREELGAYFPGTVIRGLFGKEPLYSLELNRCKKALEIARRRSPLFLRVRAGLPYWALRLVRAARRFIEQKRETSADELPDSVVRQYSTDDFFYREHDLEQALNLMAICDRE